MKRSKTLIIFLLVFSLMLTSVACGKKSGEDTSNSSSKVEDNKKDDDTKKVEDDKKEEKAKLHLLGPDKGGDIKFADREKYPVWKEVQKLLDAANLDLEYEIVPAEQYKVVIQTRMASASDLPDIANVSPLDDTTVLNLARQGVILELNSLADEHSNGNIKKFYNEYFPYAKQLTTSPDGKMYWFSNLHKKLYKGTEPAPVALTMNIRKDWLDKLNIPVPTTADEYFNALKTMRDKDANGNGQKDEILIYDPARFNGAIAQWFGLGIDITAVDMENKKVVSPWYQEGVKDYFKYLQRLVKENIIDASLIGAGSEEVQQKITENKTASITDYNLETYREPTIEGGGEYMPLMPLKAVDGIEPAAQLESPFLVWQKFAVTKNCKNPEAAIAFFDIIYSEEYADLLFWGIEGLTYEVGDDGVKKFKDITGSFDTQLANEGKIAGQQVFGDTVFPRVQFANLEYELQGRPEYKTNHQLEIMTYKPYFYNKNYLAIPDDDQLEKKTQILNDITTYSEELATKLALGQKSLDDWDKYMADLKELGLDELIEIDQQLLDRYFSLEK
ncbi:extracellular solute-binding protein [Xylanivirga thermophila]|uniref:extracellular solute-binding protein n=1 Tax=Xylanivirga thermophila TaxID=2496273 RepID=UPI00101B69A0|nr:extracellular solute-binding protein [Xylanivirga thermophila]